jgi:hypothetical protein
MKINVERKRKRNFKKEMIEYDWECYEGRWWLRKVCRKSRWMEI